MASLNSSRASIMSRVDPSPGLFSKSPYTTLEIGLIILVAGSLSLVTVIGNILVMLSIKVNRNLQTVNNYFLFSLACADLIIGVCSMNLYTVYIVIGYWPLGAVVCDLWLAVDYVVSNASVMNLLIISFDRYFCVTKPLSYPARRSTKMAGLMIAAAWVLSFILWAPAILFWQFIAGGRTVPPDQCYIEFFSNPVVTFGTAIAAFYLPVAIMIYLYWRISMASRSRVKKDSRKTSGTSLGEGPSHSQDEGCEPQNNGHRTRKQQNKIREKEMLQQENGSTLCKEEDPKDNDNTQASTSGDMASSHGTSHNEVNGARKQQPPSPGSSAADRQSLTTRTMFQVIHLALLHAGNSHNKANSTIEILFYLSIMNLIGTYCSILKSAFLINGLLNSVLTCKHTGPHLSNLRLINYVF
uniref:Muscarinic acetylcholine receptor n=1 Tax=Neogobius melanostomus TaxID=47308 RepID=A0A8C6SIQ5_9GOBI